MTTDEQTAQYTPTDEEARECYSAGRPGWQTGTPAEFDRFLARVRRDAAREALDGLITDAEADMRIGAVGHDDERIERGQAVVEAAVIFRDDEYPEETP